MDRSQIIQKIRRPNRLGHLFTRRRWNKLRDAVKNKMYKKNENSLNNIIHQANVNEIDNATYVPTENIRFTIEDEPLTNATIFNPSQNIDNYGYNENINLGLNYCMVYILKTIIFEKRTYESSDHSIG